MAMRFVISVLVTLAVLGLIACVGSAGGGGTVNLTEFKLDPSNMVIRQGQKVSINLVNKGTIVHDWTVMDLGVRSPKVQPGATSTLEFTPEKAGTFKIECTEPGHADGGMVGQLTVQ